MPRQAVSMTERQLETFSAKRGRDTWRAVGGGPKGFTVRQTTAGSTLWYYRTQGASPFALGEYRPRCADSMNMDAARKAAYEAEAAFKAGDDPHKAKRAREAAKRSGRVEIETVADAFAQLKAMKEGEGNRASSLDLDQQVFDTHIRERLGKMPLRNLTPADVLSLKAEAGKVKKMGKGRTRGGRAVAIRSVRLLRQIVTFANDFHKFGIDDPTKAVLRTGKGRRKVRRKRVLTSEELRAIWMACDDPENAPCALSPMMALAIQFAAVTLQRAGECVGISDGEIKDDVWHLPGDRVKNGQPHDVPLSHRALKILDAARSFRADKKQRGPIFSSPHDPRESMDRHSVSRAMNRLAKALKISDARTHDIRRTGATILVNDLGVWPLAVSGVLNHSGDADGAAEITKAVYIGKLSMSRKREALDKWAAELERIVGAPLPSNVTQLRART